VDGKNIDQDRVICIGGMTDNRKFRSDGTIIHGTFTMISMGISSKTTESVKFKSLNYPLTYYVGRRNEGISG